VEEISLENGNYQSNVSNVKNSENLLRSNQKASQLNKTPLSENKQINKQIGVEKVNIVSNPNNLMKVKNQSTFGNNNLIDLKKLMQGNINIPIMEDLLTMKNPQATNKSNLIDQQHGPRNVQMMPTN